MAGEFERIAEIRKRFAIADVNADGVVIGIGDDAAVLAPSASAQVLSVDAQVDGVHFRQDLLAAPEIGQRALSAALSDLAAMGASPRAALLALVVPVELSDATLYAIADGVAEAANRYGCPIIGGNLARGAQLSLTTTVIGEHAGSVLTRAGARAGDGLFVAGELGSAGLGLRALLAGRSERVPGAVARWRTPQALIAIGRTLAAAPPPGASAAIDVSDGFLQDLAHLARASNVGFEVELARLPLGPDVAEHAQALGHDPLALALGGGEDYALLFTAPANATGLPGVRVGRACEEPGIRLRNEGGAIVPPPPTLGFDHFATRGS
ncbi:MAG TPA: thiamine-phosphate kinase [Polyangiales bacterium]|nr:thiamine-phosphate kinase [Polyangiales bacterium]